jgi:hypothetical protein
MLEQVLDSQSQNHELVAYLRERARLIQLTQIVEQKTKLTIDKTAVAN